jgi:hypothetical protein
VLVLGSTYDSPEALPQRVQRRDGVSGEVTWEYFADDGALSEVAIHPDGRIFVVDEAYHTADTDLVALDGVTGISQRWPLPSGKYQTYATGPIVREDGTVVLLANPHDPCASEATTTLRLLNLDPGTNVLGSTTIAGWAGNCFFDAADYRLLPDGGDGLLVAHRWEGRVRHLDAAGTLSDETVLLPPALASGGIEAEYVLGDDAAYALVKRYSSETYTAYDVAFDPLTLAVASYAVRPGAPNLNLRFAIGGGGPYISDATSIQPGAHATQIADTLWAGWEIGPGLRRGDHTAPATSAWSHVRGDARGRNAGFETFPTPEATAITVLRQMTPISNLVGWEYGGRICRRTGEMYFASWPRTDHDAGQVVPTPCPVDPAIVTVAGYHTHPGPNPQDGPSGDDVQSYYNSGLIAFIGTAVDVVNDPPDDCTPLGNIWKVVLDTSVALNPLNPAFLVREVIACTPVSPAQ